MLAEVCFDLCCDEFSLDATMSRSGATGFSVRESARVYYSELWVVSPASLFSGSAGPLVIRAALKETLCLIKNGLSEVLVVAPLPLWA